MAKKTDRLELPRNEVIGDRYVVRKPLGTGGAGVIYEVEQLGLGVPRALKLFDPTRPGMEEEFRKTFKDEVKHLSQLTHTNIIKILDYQTLKLDDVRYPYFVMEFANGGELSSAICQVQTRDELLDILKQLFDALEYIHGRGMMHGDLKPSNVLYHSLDGPSRIEVKVADLGVSKLLRLAQESVTGPGETYVWGTRDYAAPEIRDKINLRQPVENKWLEDRRESIDLYATGVTLADLLSDKDLTSAANRDRIDELLAALRPNIQTCLTPPEQAYLKRFVRKLTEREPEKRYRTFKEARSALLRMAPMHMAFGVIPELTGVGCASEIYHGGRLIKFSDRTFRWLRHHPALQRLNNLNQLSFVFYVYPGARHSRFAHSLETFEVAREVVLHLLNDSAFRFLLDEDDISLFLAASLLHDIGHYPLAHPLEDLRPRVAPQDPMDLSIVRADYELATYFLKAHFGTVEPLWDMLSDDGIDPERLVRLVSKALDVTDAESVMQTLLDGAFDVDKIAYLRHDSQASFVRYGAGVDLEGLFTSLVALLPSEHPQLRRAQIGLLRRGISAAESIIVARYHMYNRVYWHRTNRAITAMLSYAVSRLIGGENPFISFKQYIEETRSLSDWEAVRWLSGQMQKAIDQGALTSDSGRPIRNLLPGIADGTRRLYKQLVAFSRIDDAPGFSGCHDFLLRLDRTEIEEIRTELLDLISRRTNYDDAGDEEVLIDIPQSRKELDAKPTELWVLNEQTGSVRSFIHYSQIARGAFEQHQSIANCSRIFVSPQLSEACASDRKLRDEIVDLLDRYSRRL